MFNETLTNAAYTIGIALIGLATAYVLLFIGKVKVKVDAEIAKLKDEKQRKLVQDAFARVTDLTQKTVMQLEQTTASSLRLLVADGKIEREELLAVGQKAIDEVMAQLTDETKALLLTEINDIQQYVLDTVESEVLKLKQTGVTNLPQ